MEQISINDKITKLYSKLEKFNDAIATVTSCSTKLGVKLDLIVGSLEDAGIKKYSPHKCFMRDTNLIADGVIDVVNKLTTHMVIMAAMIMELS